MIQAKDFFRSYQTSFFKLQQLINKDALDNVDLWEEKFKDESSSYSKNEITQVIKSHIRITYLHCIDTLFELIFGLYPIDGVINDKNLPLIISKNNDKFNKPRIQGLANKENDTITEIQQDITYEDNHISLLQYIFFYQINQNNTRNTKFLKNIESSLEPILDLISIFAEDLIDKSEYNSLKHALRIYPFTGSLKLLNKETNKPIAGINFKDAHQYILDTNDEIKIISKSINSDRDFKYTMIASNMIWNIIKIRDKFMVDTPTEDHCYVYFFNNKDYKEIEKSPDHRQRLLFNINKNLDR